MEDKLADHLTLLPFPNISTRDISFSLKEGCILSSGGQLVCQPASAYKQNDHKMITERAILAVQTILSSVKIKGIEQLTVGDDCEIKS